MPTDNSLYTGPVRDIMHYESDIWAVADLLLAAITMNDATFDGDFAHYLSAFDQELQVL